MRIRLQDPPRLLFRDESRFRLFFFLTKEPVSGGSGLTFKQDNATAHTARITGDFLIQNNVDILDWSAKSPDLMSRQLNTFVNSKVRE